MERKLVNEELTYNVFINSAALIRDYKRTIFNIIEIFFSVYRKLVIFLIYTNKNISKLRLYNIKWKI
jgi:hypothetical protein